MTSPRRHGWIPDVPDHRDHPYVPPAGLAASRPASVDLRPRCPAVLDQQSGSTCTANAIASAHLYDQLQQRLPSPALPSRLFLYWNERVALGTQASDSGATLRGGIKSIARQGACPEPQWPYDLAQLLVQPPDACFQAALPHRAVSYKRIHRDLDLFRACLAEGWPFVFGFSVYASFHTPAVAQSGAVPMPQHGDSHRGGHAVLAVGYDDAARTFRFLNSFGAGWGQGGYGTMPYDYLTHPHLSEDFWTLRAVAG
jgi:C1A family cysteine protease